VICATITIFTTIIVTVVCLFICYYSENNMEVLKKVLELAASTYNTTVMKLLILVVFVIFLEIMFTVLIGYLGIILGHKSNNNKMVRSIINGFAIYMIMQVLILGVLYIYGLFNPEVMNLINTTENIEIDAIKGCMYAAIGVYGVYSVILYVISKKQLKKGVNVD